MKKVFVSAFAAFFCAVAPAAEHASGTPPEQVGALVLENELLRVTVSPIGARVISLLDKIRQREDVKKLPYVGGLNEVRYGSVLNLNEARDPFTLTLTKLPDGSQKLTAIAKVQPTDDKPGAATVTKEYLLAPGSSCHASRSKSATRAARNWASSRGCAISCCAAPRSSPRRHT